MQFSPKTKKLISAVNMVGSLVPDPKPLCQRHPHSDSQLCPPGPIFHNNVYLNLK